MDQSKNIKRLFEVEIQKADVPNKNNRIYPHVVLEKAITKLHNHRKQIFGCISTNGFKSLDDMSVVNMEAVSHLVENLRMKDGALVADIRVLKNSMGDLLETMLEKRNVDFRLRGFIDFQKETPVNTGITNQLRIVRDLQIISIDVVSEGA